jgi:hypothetical protein
MQQFIPVDHLRPCFSLRSRREASAIDQINRRLYESSLVQAPYVDLNKTTYLDTQPLMSRTDTRGKRDTVAYTPGIDKGIRGPYFNQFDGTSDPQNVARELQSAVYEPVEDRGALQSARLAERQFGNRWLDSSVVQESIQLRLKAGETLLPSLNDMSKMYGTSASSVK